MPLRIRILWLVCINSVVVDFNRSRPLHHCCCVPWQATMQADGWMILPQNRTNSVLPLPSVSYRPIRLRVVPLSLSTSSMTANKPQGREAPPLPPQDFARLFSSWGLFTARSTDEAKERLLVVHHPIDTLVLEVFPFLKKNENLYVQGTTLKFVLDSLITESLCTRFKLILVFSICSLIVRVCWGF